MQLTYPSLSCEAVIAEALFLLRRGGIKPDGLLILINRGLVVPEFSLTKEIGALQHLMKTFRNIPMSLADACLVRMAEIHENSKIMTLDSDLITQESDSAPAAGAVKKMPDRIRFATVNS